MKKSFHTALLSLSTLGVLALAPKAMATASQFIIQDTFGGTNGTSLAGRAPDTWNVPATSFSYATAGDQGGTHPQIDTALGNLAPAALTGFNNAIWLSIASNGGYTKPTLLTVSVDEEMGTTAAGGNADRGVGLGFWSTANSGGTESSTNFTGLTVLPGGSLDLIVNGTASNTAIVSAFGGYSTSVFYNLSYTINTTTGGITNVIFNGNNDTSTFSGAATAGDFTAAGTNLAGFYASSNNEASTGYVDNYVVVPEPSAWLSMVGGLGLLVSFRRRRPA